MAIADYEYINGVGLLPLEWTSDGNGDATVAIGDLLKNMQITSVKTVPGADVSAYSVTLLDEDSYDWFKGEGATRSTTAAEAFFNYTEFRLPGQDLTLTISGAGDTKTGTVYIGVK